MDCKRDLTEKFLEKEESCSSEEDVDEGVYLRRHLLQEILEHNKYRMTPKLVKEESKSDNKILVRVQNSTIT